MQINIHVYPRVLADTETYRPRAIQVAVDISRVPQNTA
jgi:hypothetical protein